MEPGIFSNVEIEKPETAVKPSDFITDDLKARLADCLSGCGSQFEEIEIKGILIDYIRKM